MWQIRARLKSAPMMRTNQEVCRPKRFFPPNVVWTQAAYQGVRCVGKPTILGDSSLHGFTKCVGMPRLLLLVIRTQHQPRTNPYRPPPNDQPPAIHEHHDHWWPQHQPTVGPGPQCWWSTNHWGIWFCNHRPGYPQLINQPVNQPSAPTINEGIDQQLVAMS